jgi:hypothetical protein
VKTADVQLEMNSVYRATLGKGKVQRAYPLKVQAMPIRPIIKREKSISFYLPDNAPHIYDDVM